MDKRYIPYLKWWGTAFRYLHCAKRTMPPLSQLLQVDNWQEREETLCIAYQLAAQMHKELGITLPLDIKVRPFLNRPFRIIDASRFVHAIRDQASDPMVRKIDSEMGDIDQFSHCSDLRLYEQLHKSLKSLYN